VSVVRVLERSNLPLTPVAQHPDPLRRAILDTLDRMLANRSNLVIAARREAGFGGARASMSGGASANRGRTTVRGCGTAATTPSATLRFNMPNRVVLTTSAKAGDKFEIAIFGINGPISVAPPNFIWFREARVEFYK
jgi:hypothetical protein